MTCWLSRRFATRRPLRRPTPIKVMVARHRGASRSARDVHLLAAARLFGRRSATYAIEHRTAVSRSTAIDDVAGQGRPSPLARRSRSRRRDHRMLARTHPRCLRHGRGRERVPGSDTRTRPDDLGVDMLMRSTSTPSGSANRDDFPYGNARDSPTAHRATSPVRDVLQDAAPLVADGNSSSDGAAQRAALADLLLRRDRPDALSAAIHGCLVEHARRLAIREDQSRAPTLTLPMWLSAATPKIFAIADPRPRSRRWRPDLCRMTWRAKSIRLRHRAVGDRRASRPIEVRSRSDDRDSAYQGRSARRSAPCAS